MDKHYRPVLLMILDGWGVREMEHGNAVFQAHTPNYAHWTRTRERALLGASGEAVGLTPEQMGNSEVGHLNLGAGRVIYQDIMRIDKALQDGAFARNPTLLEAFARLKSNGRHLHLLGLLGTGGVHAHDRHFHALIRLAHEHGLPTLLHPITDGRDTSPGSAEGYMKTLQTLADETGATIASVCGRYYAMDRDKRWERTALAYRAIVEHTSAVSAPSALEALRQSYAQNISDEFILPTVLHPERSDFAFADGDALVCFNFRADRMRQIVQVLTQAQFEGRPDVAFIDGLHVLTMSEYDEKLGADVLFPMEIVDRPLAEVLSAAGKTQFHIAETEKYPHVTYFFNGRREETFAGETRTIIPSPKVATYDLKPEMSAYEVAETMIQRLREHNDDFLLINFANPDMVGHTGSLEAAIRACEAVDVCAGRVVEAVLAKGGVALVTADHGNAERMIDEVTGQPHTYHTTSAVPFFAIAHDYLGLRPRGILADVAPTVLDLLGVPQPEVMTGTSLIKFDL
jgi:2,3-bisphosphoglycerate-independent phosphoglycerate mutase